MSASHKWRPPVAPKPAIRVGADHDSGVPSSSALKGATHAFGTGSPASSAGTGAVKLPAYGALDAATTADRHSNQDGKSGTYTPTSRSPVRGRSHLSLDLRRAADHTSKPESKNPLQRTASEIAARAASASSSPVRGHPIPSRQSSPRRFQRSPSRDSTASRRGRVSSDADTRNALLGATLSMSASPPTASPFSTKTGKLDFSKIPSLAQQVSSSVTVQRPVPLNLRPTVSTDLDGHAESRPEPPQPPPKRQPQKQARQEIRHASKFTDSDMTPTLTLSKPELEPEATTQPGQTSQKASQPVPVPPKRSTKTSPNTSVSPHAPGTSSRSPRGNMTANDLANAMVGASLASSRQGSRAASPAKFVPPPVPRRRSKSVEILRPHLTGDKNPPLKPLPKRAMKLTLRKQSPEDEEEEDPRRGRKHRIRKHPHMHNEGDRKRWRDKVSEAERKRYEGVWAANRGLLHEHEVGSVLGTRPQDSTQEEMVLNVVVRDIWNRSRLPHDALEEIWDLVSPEPEYRALNRERFVVGLWLVDQRLKGRKLPVKVSASVWQSVQLVGIKVSSKPF